MATLQLERRDLMGRGQNRWVYKHPQHENRCIKVARTSAWRRRHERRETGYWRTLARRGCDFRFMPKFHGWVATNQGRGTVWEISRSADGQIATTLAKCLRRGVIEPDVRQDAFAQFQEWSLEHSVLSHDLNLLNFVCPLDSEGEFQLRLVDGWGNNEYLPVSSFSKVLARQKIDRVWRRFERRFEKYVARHLEQELPIILPFPSAATHLRAKAASQRAA